MGIRFAIRIIEVFLLFGGPLFLAAGTLMWPAGWVFVAVSTFGSLSVGLAMWRSDRGLLAERLKPLVQAGQPIWDRLILLAFSISLVGWFVVMGLDHRFGWSAMPVAVTIIGGLIDLGVWLTMEFVVRANTFLAPVVKIQHERDHKVVSGGPYGVVRHPMYAAQIAYFFASALLLGSWWGLVPAALLTVVLAVRVPLEEGMLRSSLDGYDAYMARVRYRLFPGVW